MIRKEDIMIRLRENSFLKILNNKMFVKMADTRPNDRNLPNKGIILA